MRNILVHRLDSSCAQPYSTIRLQIKDGDVLLYEGFTLPSRVIRWATRSRYSHAGVAVWWNDRLMVLEAVGHGVSVTPLSANLRHYRGHVQWFTTQKPISQAKRREMIQFAQQELGKRYALWKSIVLGCFILFRHGVDKRDQLRRENKLYCSWYVAQIYNAVGLDLKKGVSDRFMTPDDIARSPLLVHRGVLKLYRDN